MPAARNPSVRPYFLNPPPPERYHAWVGVRFETVAGVPSWPLARYAAAPACGLIPGEPLLAGITTGVGEGCPRGSAVTSILAPSRKGTGCLGPEAKPHP
jgi:hypothetical protein